MDSPISLILGIWGAVLSTILAISKLVGFLRDKPRIVVEAALSFSPVAPGHSAKGTVIETIHGMNEVCLRLSAANHGMKALQITGCTIEEVSGNIQQVVADGLPALLRPNTRIDVYIQKEWLDGVSIARIGVLDALGRVHRVAEEAADEVIRKSNALPSNRRPYQHRDSGEIVHAFQATDRVILTRQSTGA